MRTTRRHTQLPSLLQNELEAMMWWKGQQASGFERAITLKAGTITCLVPLAVLGRISMISISRRQQAHTSTNTGKTLYIDGVDGDPYIYRARDTRLAL